MERRMDETAELLPQPFKVREVAAMARISPNAVYELVRRGELPSIRLGGAIRLPRAATLKLLSGEVPVTPKAERAGRTAGAAQAA